MKRLVTVLVAVAAMLPGCRERAVTLVPETQLPEDVYRSPIPTPTKTPGDEFVRRDRRVFMVRDGRLVAIERRLPRSPTLTEALLEGLLQGPRGSKADTEIPAGTRILDVGVAGGVATVDLSREFEAGAPGRSLALRAAQVVFTLTEDPKIRQVLFRVEGEATGVLGGDQRVHRGLVTKKEYARFAPPPA